MGHRRPGRGGGRSAGPLPLKEPVLHVGDKGLEVVEAPEPRVDPPEVDVGVPVHENVPEACQALQP